MSLINQMLQDLDARRASGSELALVPRHVRALPREARSRRGWWIAAAGAALAVTGAIAWHLVAAPTPAAATVAIVRPEAPQVRESPPVPVAPQAIEPAPAPEAAVMTALIPTSAVVAQETQIAVAEKGTAAVPAAQPAAAATVPQPPATPPAPQVAATAPVQQAPAPAPQQSARDKSAASARTVAMAEPPSAGAQIDKRAQQPTARELAENDYRDGTNLLHQGRLVEAQQKYRIALQHLPGYAAPRQALFGLLVESKRLGEAEQLLQEGLRANSAQPGFAMALARLQVDRGDTAAAIETLQATAPSALGSPDYIAFLAALLQRQNRHAEAVEHYQTALSLAPGSSLWSMGLAISLQALNRTNEARGAFRRALAGNALTPDLQAFVNQRLQQLQ